MGNTIRSNSAIIEGSFGGMEQASNYTKNIAQRMMNVSSNLAGNNVNYILIRRQMSKLNEQLLKEAAKLSTMKEAMQQILSVYDGCEREIIGQVNGTDASGGNGALYDAQGTDKRNFFERLIDWLSGDEPDTQFTATSSEEESANDRAMMARIQTLNNNSAYSERAWRNADTQERIEMLRNYMQCVAAIVGVNITGGLCTLYELPEDGMILNGQFDPSTNAVSINTYILEEYSAHNSYRLFSTIVHEVRHAYQHAAVDNPSAYIVSSETIASWEESFRTYQQESDSGNYRNIVVEVDARNFAGEN